MSYKHLSFFLAIIVMIVLGVLLYQRSANNAFNEANNRSVLQDRILQHVEDVEPINPPLVEAPIIIETTHESQDPESEEPKNAEAKTTTEKVTKYHNKALEYGFLMPYGTYYSGFGPQEDAQHSVSMHSSEIPDGYEDGEVRVLYYGANILPELTNVSFYQAPEGNTTHLKLLDKYSFKIIGDYESEIVNKIIQTIFIGPSNEEEEEKSE